MHCSSVEKVEDMAAAGLRLDVLEPHQEMLMEGGRELSRVLATLGDPFPENKEKHAQKSASNSILIKQKTVQTLLRQRTSCFTKSQVMFQKHSPGLSNKQ